ncbi:MAG: hypothetical protein ACK40G_16575 [Cytophagaceae bacterium]
MKQLYLILILSIGVFVCFAQDASSVSGQSKKTTFNDAAAALSNKAIGDFFPMYDKQVNQILRMCDKGNDIPGSVNALVNLGVYLGSDLDPEEEEVIIKGSKIDVNLYNEICKSIVTSFSKPLNSSVAEAVSIIKAVEEGKGKDVLTGIKILSKVKYRMRTGNELIVTADKLNLWAEVGKINEKDFADVYKALLSVGLEPELNEVSTTALLGLMKANKPDAIIKAVSALSTTGWRCEGELDHREKKVIESVITNKYEEEVKETLTMD